MTGPSREPDEAASSPPPARPPAGESFAARLDRLFATVRPPGRAGEYTYEQVAAGIAERGGPTISASYLYLLRRGVRDNPTKRHLEALAFFFGVPVSYFFDAATAGDLDPTLLAALGNPRVRAIAVEAAGLSEDGLELTSQVLSYARRLEGRRSPEFSDGDSATLRGREVRAEDPSEPASPGHELDGEALDARDDSLSAGQSKTPNAREDLAFARLAMTHGEAQAAKERLEGLLEAKALLPQERDEALLLLGRVLEQIGDLRGAQKTLTLLLERIFIGKSDLDPSEVGMTVLRAYLEANDIGAAASSGEIAMSAVLRQRKAQSDSFLRFAATYASVFLYSGDYLVADSLLAQFLEMADEQGSSLGQGSIRWNVASLAESRGNLGASVAMGREALRLLSEQGGRRDLARLMNTVAGWIMYLDPANVPEAVALLGESHPLTEDLGSPVDLAYWENSRSLAALHQSDPKLSEGLALQALGRLPADTTEISLVLLIRLGDVAAISGRVSDSVHWYRRAADLFARQPVTRILSQLAREIADRAALLEGAGQAVSFYRSALDMAGIRGDCLTIPRAVPRPRLPSTASAEDKGVVEHPERDVSKEVPCDDAVPEEPRSEVLEAIAFARFALVHGEASAARDRLIELLATEGLPSSVSEEAQLLLARAHASVGDLVTAVQVVRPLFERSLSAVTDVSAAEIAMALVRFELDASWHEMAIRDGENALLALGHRSEITPDARVRLAVTLAAAYLDNRDLTLAGALLDHLVRFADREGTVLGRASARWNSVLLADMRAQSQKALDLARETFGLLLEAQSPRDLARFIGNLVGGLLDVSPPAVTEAVSIVEGYSTLVEDYCTQIEIFRWENDVAILRLLLGDPSEAENLCRRGLQRPGASGEDACSLRVTLGDALMAQGLPSEAIAEYRTSALLLQEVSKCTSASFLGRKLADRFLMHGNAREAIAAYQLALAASGVRGPILRGVDPLGAPLAGRPRVSTLMPTDSSAAP